MLWAVNPGQDSATVIASITPETIPLEVLDISPDGSNALIRVGHISPPGFTPECADLYMVRTDGSGATRLTRFGTGRFVTGGAFSPDSRRVAYAWWDPNTITTLDLETGATADQSCTTLYGIGPTRIDWSPTGDKFAVGCERTLTIFDASGTTAPAKFRMAEEPLAFRWSDDRQLVVASGGGNIYSFDVPSATSTLLGRFEDPAIVITSATGVFSPDGRWLAYHGGERGDRPGNAFREVGYLVATSGGTPTRIPGELQDTTWSADSRALVSVTGGEDAWNLVRMDVETLQSSTIGTIINGQPFPSVTDRASGVSRDLVAVPQSEASACRGDLHRFGHGWMRWRRLVPSGQMLRSRRRWSPRLPRAHPRRPLAWCLGRTKHQVDEPWIAYQWVQGDGDGIYLARPDGTDPHELLSDAGYNAFHPDWSPDGIRIAFDAETGGGNEIWVVNADGTNAAAIVPRIPTARSAAVKSRTGLVAGRFGDRVRPVQARRERVSGGRHRSQDVASGDRRVLFTAPSKTA
jgi:Tol biopolymer transport system component